MSKFLKHIVVAEMIIIVININIIISIPFKCCSGVKTNCPHVGPGPMRMGGRSLSKGS